MLVRAKNSQISRLKVTLEYNFQQEFISVNNSTVHQGLFVKT